jgi:alkylhydroperoxidase family enzyme
MAERTTDAVLDTVLADRRDVRDALAAAWDAAWACVDPVLLELCRLRIAMLLGCADEKEVRTPIAVDGGLDDATVAVLARWPYDERFGRRERACLAFTEQFVIDVAGLDDTTALAVRDELGSDGLADFVNALLVVEQRQRLRQTWAHLFEDAPRADLTSGRESSQPVIRAEIVPEAGTDPAQMSMRRDAGAPSTTRARRLQPGSGLAQPLRSALGAWQAAVVRLDRVDAVTTELVRLRCARHHDCHT